MPAAFRPASSRSLSRGDANNAIARSALAAMVNMKTEQRDRTRFARHFARGAARISPAIFLSWRRLSSLVLFVGRRPHNGGRNRRQLSPRARRRRRSHHAWRCLRSCYCSRTLLLQANGRRRFDARVARLLCAASTAYALFFSLRRQQLRRLHLALLRLLCRRRRVKRSNSDGVWRVGDAMCRAC